jgi:hypothetical protein
MITTLYNLLFILNTKRKSTVNFFQRGIFVIDKAQNFKWMRISNVL